MANILEYLSIEMPDGDQLTASDLKFLRTAEIYDESFFWTWEFEDPSDGVKCYVTVEEKVHGGSTCVGYDEDYYGLTPEQFILGTYHNVF